MQNYWITTHSDCEELEHKSSNRNSCRVSDDVPHNNSSESWFYLDNCGDLYLTEIVKYGPGCGYATGVDQYIHCHIHGTSGGLNVKVFHHENRFCVVMPAIVSKKS
jgi:hypothetical protein